MTDSNRHTIFVALGKNGETATTRIHLTPGWFKVCDGNGFDAAYDCSGNQIGRGQRRWGSLSAALQHQSGSPP